MRPPKRLQSLRSRGQSTKTSVQLIVTPGSGEGRALGTAQGIERALARVGYTAGIQTFDDLESLLHWADNCQSSFSHLVCVGGDGTQSAAARAAIRLGVPLVPVPTGFGNMFARAFGHRAEPEAVVSLMERGEVCAIDVGTTGDDLFLSHKSYGPLQDTEASVEGRRDRLRPRLLRTLAYYAMGGRYL